MSCPAYASHEMHVSASRTRALRLFQFGLYCLLTQANVTAAAPHHARLQARDSAGSNASDMSTKVWVTLTVLLAICFVFLACLCSKRAILRFFGRYAGPAGQAANTRELTADQLAGSINRNVNDGNNANNTTNGRPRRTRRPRRTPSQISTTSLPAYMKDPGEHELVVYRGPMDLEDMPQPTATVLLPMGEYGEQPSLRSQSTRYPHVSNSSSEIPLLRPSTSSDSSNNSLHRTPSNNDSPDARGDAPPYDEAIRATPMESPLEEIDLTDPSAAPASPMIPEQPRTQRMSGFRSFLNAMSPFPQGIPSNDLRIGHRRIDSNTSNVSSIASPSRTRSRLTHHSSPSTSSSIFGALSRQRSMRSLAQGPLNSPSVISFNSISSPLTHTLVRTDITFPKSGPTAEQIKAISSRDALGRFGVPYGADAIAYAASTSRQDLPPDFESATSTANLLARIDSSASSASHLHFPTAPSGDATSGSLLNPSSTPETATSAPVEVESYARIELDVIPQTPVDAPEEATPSSPTHTAQAPLNSSPSSTMGTHKSKQSLPLPPSSFHAPSPTESGRRNDSRMSSYSVRSYATAEESLSPPASVYHDTFSSPLNSSPPETPKIGGQHVLEPSNASTLTPATIYAAGGSSNTDSS